MSRKGGLRGRARLAIRVDPNGELARGLSDAIAYYSTLPDRLTLAARRAMQRTYLAEFQKVFLARFYRSLEMHVEKFDGDQAGKSALMEQEFAAQRTYMRATHRLNMAQRGGDSARIASARMSLDSAREEWMVQTRRRAGSKTIKSGGSLTSGLFRQRAAQILDAITDGSRTKVTRSPDSASFGAGALSEISKIETPSNTPLLFGTDTSSRFTMLWRQLEFGTGSYAKDGPFYQKPRWQYPTVIRKPGGGSDDFFVIPTWYRGTKPMHVLAELTKESRRLTNDFKRHLLKELGR